MYGQSVSFFSVLAAWAAAIASWRSSHLAKRLIDEQTRPQLLIYFRPKQGNIYRIRNIGNAPAMSIKMKAKDKAAGFRIELDVEKPSVLTREEEKTLKVRCLSNNNRALLDVDDETSSAHAVINPKTAKQGYKIEVTYEDISGQTYTSNFKTVEDGVRHMSTVRG